MGALGVEPKLSVLFSNTTVALVSSTRLKPTLYGVLFLFKSLSRGGVSGLSRRFSCENHNLTLCLNDCFWSIGSDGSKIKYWISSVNLHGCSSEHVNFFVTRVDSLKGDHDQPEFSFNAPLYGISNTITDGSMRFSTSTTPKNRTFVGFFVASIKKWAPLNGKSSG